MRCIIHSYQLVSALKKVPTVSVTKKQNETRNTTGQQVMSLPRVLFISSIDQRSPGLDNCTENQQQGGELIKRRPAELPSERASLLSRAAQQWRLDRTMRPVGLASGVVAPAEEHVEAAARDVEPRPVLPRLPPQPHHPRPHAAAAASGGVASQEQPTAGDGERRRRRLGGGGRPRRLHPPPTYLLGAMYFTGEIDNWRWMYIELGEWCNEWE